MIPVEEGFKPISVVPCASGGYDYIVRVGAREVTRGHRANEGEANRAAHEDAKLARMFFYSPEEA